MGFCGEMRLGRTPEKGTGGSGEGGATRGQAPKPCWRPLGTTKKNYRPPKYSLRKAIVLLFP